MKYYMKRWTAFLLAGVMIANLGTFAYADAPTSETTTNPAMFEAVAGGAYMTERIGEGAVVNLEGSENVAGVSKNLENYYKKVAQNQVKDKEAVAIAKIMDKKASVLKHYKRLGIADVRSNNYLNVRKKASTKSKSIGKMTNYDACEILYKTKDGLWYKIKSGSVRGYVYAEYIITGAKAQKIAIEKAERLAVCKSDANLNVRKKPSKSAKIITKISKNERYHVVSVKKGWVKIELGENSKGKMQYGYIAEKYCDVRYDLYHAVKYEELSVGKNGKSGYSSRRISLVNYALQFVGNRYVWGGTSLTRGADCSGFVLSVFRHYGISLPRSSAAQARRGRRISRSELQPGDLVFYGYGRINHVAIYIGGGKIVHAANPRRGIVINNMNYMTPVRYTRVMSGN